MKNIRLTIILLLLLLFLAPITSAVYLTSGTATRPSYVDKQIIVKYKSGQNPVDLKTRSNTFSISAVDRANALQDYNAIKQINQSLGIINTDTAQEFAQDSFVYNTNGSQSVDAVVAGLGGNDTIEYVQPNYLYYPMGTPNDPLYSQMWGLAKINMPTAWDKTTGSRSVIVADLDTGIDQNHPDLAANISEVKNFGCGEGDSIHHGTHTAGTIGAVGNNGAGVTGVNWTVSILAVKVFCGEGASTSALTQGVDFAVSKGAKVINMSLGDALGARRINPSFQTAIRNAVNAGTTVVVAAGNCGRTPSSTCPRANISADEGYPSNDPNVITVAATTSSDSLAGFSSTGSSVDVAAPGQDIASTVPGARYQSMSGTSMATPHVTGLVGLMYALNPSIRPSEVKSILESTAVDLGRSGRDEEFGAGRINAAAALNRVGGGGGGPIPPTPTPGTRVTPPARPTSPSDCDPNDPTAPCSQPTPTPGTGICKPGDYNCDGAINEADYTKWAEDFVSGKTVLAKYEDWRRAMFSGR